MNYVCFSFVSISFCKKERKTPKTNHRKIGKRDERENTFQRINACLDRTTKNFIAKFIFFFDDSLRCNAPTHLILHCGFWERKNNVKQRMHCMVSAFRRVEFFFSCDRPIVRSWSHLYGRCRHWFMVCCCFYSFRSLVHFFFSGIYLLRCNCTWLWCFL